MVRLCFELDIQTFNPAPVSFEAESQGQLAMVIYEWSDYKYLGKVTSKEDDFLPVSVTRTCLRLTFTGNG